MPRKGVLFKNLCKNKSKFLKDPSLALTTEGLTELVCKDCDFYKEGEDEELACSAYNMLSMLLEKKVITVEELIDALTEEGLSQ